MASPEWAAAERAIEVAQAADRLWRAASEVRIAKLKQAAELERQGRIEEAAAVLAEVKKELKA